MDADTDPKRLDGFIATQEVLDSWQARVLRASSPKMFKFLLSVIAHSYDASMCRLLDAIFPGWVSIDAPFFCSAGKIAKTGHVCADVITKDEQIVKMFVLFRNTRHMESIVRKFADKAKLNDRDRIEFVDAVKRWVVCDYRLDPSMDPADPDAKRLTVN